jgi:hypothetical protein
MQTHLVGHGAPARSLISIAVGGRGVFAIVCGFAALVPAANLLMARRAPAGWHDP